uniref:Ty3 transposon capsid-like protein domain-containing protein n=1 Tax=Nymphaea colorata TaxID=210225 RepID=A0A5K0WI92_9MAGN
MSRPVTAGIRAQILLNLEKQSESRCRASRRLAAVEEDAMTSQYNMQGAKGKEPAYPKEASLAHDQGDLEETVNWLVADVATHEEALSFATKTFERLKEEMKLMREQMAELVAMNQSLSNLVKILQDKVAGLRASNQKLLRTNSASNSQERSSRVDVQRPMKYSDSRDARAIDNFLFQVDYYMNLQNVVEEDLKIKTVAMLLEGDAMAWWRRKMLDIENGDCTIRTFDDFRKQLKGYFMPVDAERHAYQLVANLKQTGALRDYIRAYQKVMLDVPMMPEKDKLHWFIIGLQSWAQADVERSNPKTLEQAYVATERLADTQRKSYTDTFKSTKQSDHDCKREEW